ncbi:protein FD-like [Durio zibethinus]|uniref:Protein FD-like n=1 Tax=Durio zibethinus TaxID=66656 RepID=A0A6P6ANU6_DURZI|nr:protein FD-like [Durio zibethinus]
MCESPDRNSDNSSSNMPSISLSKPSPTSTYSLPAPCSPPSSITPNLSAKNSMEEVWKDIGLASLNDHPAGTVISTSTNNLTFPSMILLDFLARPINKEPPTRSGVSNDTSLAEETTLFGSLAATPGKVWRLNSKSDFLCIESGDPVRPNPAVQGRSGVATPSFGSSAVFPFFCKKRAQENNDNSDDPRHKRMMKNRESAARSRARKQAYTYQLEHEVTRLQEENAKLRRQQEKLLAADSDHLPKKNTLRRTLTAPF